MADQEVKHVLLQGVVGSTAYGLATPESDVDRLGVFAWPTSRWFDLEAPRETVDSHDPDNVLHEAAKACRLMLKGNPTVTEMLWLDEYEYCTALGEELIGIRDAFLSAPRVLESYLGYAKGQFHRLMNRGRFAPDIPERRTAKHARHIWRLVNQGRELYTTGKLTIRLENPEACRQFGERVANDPQHGGELIEAAEYDFATASTVLPEEPDVARVEGWLHRVRDYYYWEPGC